MHRHCLVPDAWSFFSTFKELLSSPFSWEEGHYSYFEHLIICLLIMWMKAFQHHVGG